MSNDKLWVLTVVAALSSLLILAYFTLSPMVSKEGTAQRVETGLHDAISKFDSMKNGQDSVLVPTAEPET